MYFLKLNFSYPPSICRSCGWEKSWIKSKDNTLEDAECRGKWLFFPSRSLCNISFLTFLNRPGCPGSCWFSAHKHRGWRRAHLPKTLVLSFNYCHVAGKASTFNQEPSEFPWKVTYLYLSLTLSAAKLLGFWRKPPFLAYSSHCSWSSWPLQNPIRKESKECRSGWGPLCCPSLDSQQLARHQWQSWLAQPARDHRIPGCLLSKVSPNPFENKGLLSHIKDLSDRSVAPSSYWEACRNGPFSCFRAWTSSPRTCSVSLGCI